MMKPSEILRKAAKIAHDIPAWGDEWRCGCGAIDDAALKSDWSLHDKCMDYFLLFKPDNNISRWFGTYCRFDVDGLPAKEHRVIALCMAAAIAESESR